MNCFSTKIEVQESFNSMIKPLIPFFDESNLGRLKLGSHGTVYSESTRGVEAFLRPLWGIGPYLVDAEDDEILNHYIDGIVAGTNPKSDFYWGDAKDFDQLIVEMASLSTFILLNKEKFWERLSVKEQENIHRWLTIANERQLPKNNWYFFRILINVAMKKMKMPYSQERIDSDFKIINSFYRDKGWYCDGEDTQFDYYVSFAIHYYSLVYAAFMEDDDPERVGVIKERAIIFTQSFKYWFDANGEGLPFGRSLTYRFAQISFFSALVFANVEALPWGEIKGLISRHMKNWFSKEIFSTDGLLTVGYHYENLVFAEGYNSYGSPYWALKSYLLLAVPSDHPYWESEPLPLSIEKRNLASPESRNFYQFNQDLTHLQSFPAGQFVHNQNHPQAKYSKFVYSTIFGFSVPKQNYRYYEGAYDSILALSKDEHYFRTKDLDNDFEILEDRIIHYWQPWNDVVIKSIIIPLETCHVRIHEIETMAELTACEGGFSVPFQGEELTVANGLVAEFKSKIGVSSVEGVVGFDNASIARVEPNTNLFYQRTVLPFLTSKVPVGKTMLVSIISGVKTDEVMERPIIDIKEDDITIRQKNKEINIRI